MTCPGPAEQLTEGLVVAPRDRETHRYHRTDRVKRPRKLGSILRDNRIELVPRDPRS